MPKRLSWAIARTIGQVVTFVASAVAWAIDLAGLAPGLPLQVIGLVALATFGLLVFVDKYQFNHEIEQLKDTKATLAIIGEAASWAVGSGNYSVQIQNHGPASATNVHVRLSDTNAPNVQRSEFSGIDWWSDREINPGDHVLCPILSLAEQTRADRGTVHVISLMTSQAGGFEPDAEIPYSFEITVTARNHASAKSATLVTEFQVDNRLAISFSSNVGGAP